MGEVWLARKVGSFGFERLVAVKLIRNDLASNENVRKMFVDEALVLSKLIHPVVAQVLEFGEKYGTLYFTMEYVPGLSLSRLMARRGRPVEPVVAARMVAEIARGLHAVHEQTNDRGVPMGIIHRDVSPQNIMVSFDGQMKLIDFGIALMENRKSEPTSVGLVKGKISYVAPEQILGIEADRRSDVYSLSIVLYELLTGQTLFEVRSNPIDAAKDRDSPRRPSSVVKVPKLLERIVMKGLKADRTRRWQDGREMAEALETFASRAGGPSLGAFAESELATDRVAHQVWIKSLAGTESAEILPPPTELLEDNFGIELGSSAIIALAPEPTIVRRRQKFRWAIVVVLAIGFGAVVAWLSAGEPSELSRWLKSRWKNIIELSSNVSPVLPPAEEPRRLW